MYVGFPHPSFTCSSRCIWLLGMRWNYSNIYPTICDFNTVYLYLETALHVSGGASTHHQERKQLYLHCYCYLPL